MLDFAFCGHLNESLGHIYVIKPAANLAHFQDGRRKHWVSKITYSANTLPLKLGKINLSNSS